MRKRDTILNADRRKTILKTAGECFVSRGFHATSMKDICAASNMSPGTLYHYFSSKTELISGIIAEEAQLTVAILSPLRDSTDIVAALADVLDIIVTEVTPADLALRSEIFAEIQRHPELRDAQAKRDRTAYAIVLEAMMQGQARGQVDKDIDITHAAKLVLTLVDGMLWRAKLEGNAALKDYLPVVKLAFARLLAAPAQAAS